MTDQSSLWADKYGINLGYLGMLYKNIKVFDNGYIICGNGDRTHEYEQILDKNLNIIYKIVACIGGAPRVVWNSYINNKSRIIDPTREMLYSIYSKNKPGSNEVLPLVMFRYSLSEKIDSELLEFVHASEDSTNEWLKNGWLKYDAFLVDNRNCIVPKIGSIYLDDESDRTVSNRTVSNRHEGFYSLTSISLLKCLTDVLNTFSIQAVKVTKDNVVIQRPWSYLYETTIKEEFSPEAVSRKPSDRGLPGDLVRYNQDIDKETYSKEIDSLYERARQSEKAINFMIKLKNHDSHREKCEDDSCERGHGAFKFLTDMPLGAATKFVTSDSVHYVTDIQWDNVDEVVIKVEPYFVSHKKETDLFGS